jgi:hypothetical protein
MPRTGVNPAPYILELPDDALRCLFLVPDTLCCGGGMVDWPRLGKRLLVVQLSGAVIILLDGQHIEVIHAFKRLCGGSLLFSHYQVIPLLPHARLRTL